MGVFFVSCSSVNIFHVQTTGWHPMRSHWFLCNFYKRRLDGNDLDVNRWEIHLSSDVRAAAADEGRGRNWQPQRHGNDVRRRSIWTVQCWCNLRIRWCERVCNAITGIDFFNGREHRFFSRLAQQEKFSIACSRMLVNAPQWTNSRDNFTAFHLLPAVRASQMFRAHLWWELRRSSFAFVSTALGKLPKIFSCCSGMYSNKLAA